ncbi:UNVERIFIED_CONTAM: hypothetical protein NCL1_24928 [Trichonephila clavipes]
MCKRFEIFDLNLKELYLETKLTPRHFNRYRIPFVFRGLEERDRYLRVADHTEGSFQRHDRGDGRGRIGRTHRERRFPRRSLLAGNSTSHSFERIHTSDDPDEEDCPECQETLADLENIDDDTDRHGILFVKTTDDSIAADYGITRFPALIYFENNVPSIYEGGICFSIRTGDISAEEEVLQWLIHSKSEDTIETVNRDMCDKLIENTPYLVVLFCKSVY